MELTKKLDKVFSIYIRLRDSKGGNNAPCISCGRGFPYKEMDAGHYISRSNKCLRWNEENVNAECRECNRLQSNHIDHYRDSLTKKIGLSSVKKLEKQVWKTKKWTDQSLQKKIDEYKLKTKNLEKSYLLNFL